MKAQCMCSKAHELNVKKDQLDDDASKLAAVLNTVIDGIISIDQRGIVQSFNPSAERIFGYLPEEVLGKNVNMLMPDPYHSEHDSYLHNYLKTGDKKVIDLGREVKARRKDGSIFSMELRVNEMDISGEVMFVGTIRDISDRKNAEQALKDNQATLQAIVDNTVDGLITISEFGAIETFNKACEKIFGYDALEVIGNNVKMLMPDPYQREHDSYLNNYHTSGTKKIIGIGREVEGKRKDGSTFPLDLSVSEVNVLGRKLYSGIVRDISARKQAEAEIKQANAELEEFAYRTSHDLRSPLISSIRLLDVVSEAIENDNKNLAGSSVKLIQSSLRTLETLVKDILLLTKVQHEEEVVQPFELNVLVHSAVERIKHMSNFERLDIHYHVDNVRDLSLAKSHITLIVENLLSNAVKYQDLKKSTSFIRISTLNYHGRLALEVADNGLGIPANQRENLFKMFKRFHPKTSFGSGLGLYMMKKSADKLGAELLFNSVADETRFTLVLPSQYLPNTNNLNE